MTLSQHILDSHLPQQGQIGLPGVGCERMWVVPGLSAPSTFPQGHCVTLGPSTLRSCWIWSRLERGFSSKNGQTNQAQCATIELCDFRHSVFPLLVSVFSSVK